MNVCYYIKNNSIFRPRGHSDVENYRVASLYTSHFREVESFF